MLLNPQNEDILKVKLLQDEEINLLKVENIKKKINIAFSFLGETTGIV